MPKVSYTEAYYTVSDNTTKLTESRGYAYALGVVQTSLVKAISELPIKHQQRIIKQLEELAQQAEADPWK